MKELDFDSYLAQEMIDLDDACACCEAILDSLEYSYNKEKKVTDNSNKSKRD